LTDESRVVTPAAIAGEVLGYDTKLRKAMWRAVAAAKRRSRK
jgi:hypothetical protein